MPVDAGRFVYSFLNRLGDRNDFCRDWALSDAHTVVQFRNWIDSESSFVRLTNWFEDRHSPFSEMYKALKTVPGAVYNVKARVRVDSRDAEFFMLKSKPRIPRGPEPQDQPCADGMVSVEHCPRHSQEKAWGCTRERSAYLEPGNNEWTTLDFEFTAVVEVSYLVFKVRFDAPLLVDAVSVTDTGRRESHFDSPCDCLADVLPGSPGEGIQVEEGKGEEPSTAGSRSPVADCVRLNCVEFLTRCESDDVCAHLFPQVF